MNEIKHLDFDTFRKEHGVGDDFLGWLIFQQLVFEVEREGTDGSLYNHNTLEFGLQRGVIGEAQEALDELEELKRIQVLTPDQEELIQKTWEHVKTELADVLIFLASTFLHAGMSGQEVMILVIEKMEKNRKKYAKEHFRDRTVDEAIKYSRDKHNGKLPEQLVEMRRRNGHPYPGNDRESWENGQTGESRLSARRSLLGEPLEPSSNGNGKASEEFEIFTAAQGAIN